ncbi:MAG: lipopolysaccharide heptosyltransferase II [Saprospiraceae bacterium]|nr:lipopolysaccharide heptosyltransferase II [Pyrinomonadaceae bacterium]
MNSTSSKNSINSIVVHGTNWVGDAIMTVPALRELRRLFPDAAISLLTRSWAEGIFSNASFIDEIIVFNQGKSRIGSVFDQSKYLRDLKFDLAVLLPNSFRSALTAKLAFIPRRIGYNKDLRGLLLTDPIAVPEWKNGRHEVFYYLNLVAEVEKRFLGTETVLLSAPDTTVEVSDERKVEARTRLATAGAEMSKNIVALGVGSTNSRAKRWPAKHYARLNDRLQSEMNASVILVGSKAEIDVSNEVARLSKRKPLLLTGTTDIGQAAAILSEVDLLISNDMGLAHLAPAVGTKTLVIFGPTNSDTTRPFSPNAAIIRENVECSPCMLRDCPIDHRCMTRISADEVFRLAVQTLTNE